MNKEIEKQESKEEKERRSEEFKKYHDFYAQEAGLTGRDWADIDKRSAERARAEVEKLFKPIRPSVDRGEFIERTVQSLAHGYSYGQVPDYYAIANSVWRDRESFWDAEEHKERERILHEQQWKIREHMVIDLTKDRLYVRFRKDKEEKEPTKE